MPYRKNKQLKGLFQLMLSLECKVQDFALGDRHPFLVLDELLF